MLDKNCTTELYYKKYWRTRYFLLDRLLCAQQNYTTRSIGELDILYSILCLETFMTLWRGYMSTWKDTGTLGLYYKCQIASYCLLFLSALHHEGTKAVLAVSSWYKTNISIHATHYWHSGISKILVCFCGKPLSSLFTSLYPCLSCNYGEIQWN